VYRKEGRKFQIMGKLKSRVTSQEVCVSMYVYSTEGEKGGRAEGEERGREKEKERERESDIPLPN